MAKAQLKTEDQIFSPIAKRLRERAVVYRSKGYESMAQDLEREAADAELMSNIGREGQAPPSAPPALTVDVALRQWKERQLLPPRTPAPPLREKHYKPGTRQPAKTPDVVTGELSWWARAKPGEMTKTAAEHRERMQGSKEAKKVDGGKISD